MHQLNWHSSIQRCLTKTSCSMKHIAATFVSSSLPPSVLKSGLMGLLSTSWTNGVGIPVLCHGWETNFCVWPVGIPLRQKCGSANTRGYVSDQRHDHIPEIRTSNVNMNENTDSCSNYIFQMFFWCVFKTSIRAYLMWFWHCATL